MYRIVPVKSSVGGPWIAPLSLIVAISAAVYAMFTVARNPNGLQGWSLAAVVTCSYVAVIGVIVAFLFGCLTWSEYRNGRRVVFDDHLTVHYPWPLKSCTYNWQDIKRVEAIDEQMIVREPEFWVPVPVGAIVPGCDLLLNLEFGRDRITSVRKFRIIHMDGRQLVEISGDTRLIFTVVRWLSRKALHDAITAWGGTITWSGDVPKVISLRRSRVTAEHWTAIKDALMPISGVEEIDLAETLLGDEALAGLEAFSSLRKVYTRGSRIEPEASDRLVGPCQKSCVS